MSALDRILDPWGTQKRLAELMAVSDERSRELAQVLEDLSTEMGQLAEIRAWLATYPPIPDDVTGDPEAMIVVRLRRILEGDA